MRKKIEELRNKEEGFTLVELLAVIVILGIIVAIAIPVIGNVTDRAQSGANEAQKELVIDAAQLYMVENPKGVVWNDHKASISVKEHLIDKGYLENDSKLYSSNSNVEVTRKPVGGSVATDTNPAYTYTYDYSLPKEP